MGFIQTSHPIPHHFQPSSPNHPTQTTQTHPTQTIPETHTTQTTQTTVETKNKYALLIGILYRRTANQLQGCVNDVENLYQLLLTKGYKEEHMKRMIDSDENMNTKLFPTRANVIAAFQEIIGKAKIGDHVTISYSGHGSHEHCTDGSESDGEDEDICCFDPRSGIQMLKDNDIRKELVEKLPDGVRLLLVSDSCHSGTIIDPRYRYNIKLGLHESLKEKPSTKRVISVSGCEDADTSADAYIGGKSQGALTYYVIQTIKTMKPGTTWRNFITLVDHALYQGGYSQVSTLGFFDAKILDEPVDY